MKPVNPVGRVLPVMVVALATLVAPCPAKASDFTVSPTEVNLSAATTSALVTLRNEGQTPLRFEISVLVWREDEAGTMQLTPAPEVTFFPKLIELGAGASRNIRVGIGTSVAGGVERSYRLFVEELPNDSAPKATMVALRTKIGIPIFVRPSQPVRSAVVESVGVEPGGTVSVRVKNTGNLHAIVDSLTIVGRNAGNAATFTHDVKGWYVLPGATRAFRLALTPAECRATTSLAVTVSLHDSALTGSGTVPAAACGGR